VYIIIIPTIAETYQTLIKTYGKSFAYEMGISEKSITKISEATISGIDAIAICKMPNGNHTIHLKNIPQMGWVCADVDYIKERMRNKKRITTLLMTLSAMETNVMPNSHKVRIEYNNVGVFEYGKGKFSFESVLKDFSCKELDEPVFMEARRNKKSDSFILVLFMGE